MWLVTEIPTTTMADRENRPPASRNCVASDNAFQRPTRLVTQCGLVFRVARSATRRISGAILENRLICCRTSLKDAILGV
jgi:hypothetical protein